MDHAGRTNTAREKPIPNSVALIARSFQRPFDASCQAAATIRLGELVKRGLMKPNAVRNSHRPKNMISPDVAMMECSYRLKKER